MIPFFAKALGAFELKCYWVQKGIDNTSRILELPFYIMITFVSYDSCNVKSSIITIC